MLSVALRSNSSLASLDVRSTGITGLGALELAEVLDRDACSLVELRMGGVRKALATLVCRCDFALSLKPILLCTPPYIIRAPRKLDR